MKCKKCGLVEATASDFHSYAEGEGEHLCWQRVSHEIMMVVHKEPYNPDKHHLKE